MKIISHEKPRFNLVVYDNNINIDRPEMLDVRETDYGSSIYALFAGSEERLASSTSISLLVDMKNDIVRALKNQDGIYSLNDWTESEGNVIP